MHLYAVPMIFILAGLTFYVVLGGADFGAGIWQLSAGRGERAERLRDHAHDSMAPVWEANHVWLIFVITVMWTAYPQAFGSIASTLALPLFVGAIGIILRGAAYALRAGTRTPGERRVIDTVFALSSVLTPFALGTIAGAIAALRVPVGNAAGGLVSSWAAGLPVLTGALAIAFGAYLAAVFLAADAGRVGDHEMEASFRTRALIAGVIAGALAAAGLAVLHLDALRLYHRLLGMPALVVSMVAGVAALGLVLARRHEPARYLAALAVAAIVAGWAAAQQPVLLRGLSIAHAAASHDVLVSVIVVVLGGAVLLFPSLALLFRLALGGRLDEAHPPAAATPAPAPPIAPAGTPRRGALAARCAVALLLAGFGLLTVADAGWAHAIGVVCLLAFVPAGVIAVSPHRIAAEGESQRRMRRAQRSRTSGP
jgi:cytochrome d ubiquinol oxidase subunit II